MRTLIKRLLLHAGALLSPDRSGKVIYYHDLGMAYSDMGTPMDLFKLHVSFAKEHGYHFVAALEPGDSDHCLQVCFDDGFKGIWDARGYLDREALFPTVSIAVDLIGRAGYLDWPQILELQKRGFRFQSHTWSHRSLTKVKPQELEQEIKGSRLELSERLGHEVDELCFPRGLFSGAIAEMATTAGYRKLYTCIPGSCRKGIDYLLPEVPSGILVPRNIVQGASQSEFSSVLRGGLAPMARRYIKAHLKTPRGGVAC